jgi:glycine/D-amino acid oxidase-like deaminating enzyme
MRDTPISLWDKTAAERDIDTPFEPGGTYDVVIVGGGYTGLSTALHAAEKGLSAYVIEAEHVGYGGSGRNAGLVNAGVWMPPDKVVKTLGPERGPRFVERFGDGPRRVFELIERHQIRCEVTREGTIHAAHAASGFENLRRRYEAWKELGAPVELLGRDEVAERIGTKFYVGGLLDRRAGTINPMGYCRGLARAALGAGAEIGIGARVTSLNREGNHWRVGTDKGEVTGKNVVLGTNAYTDTLWPGLSKGFRTIHYLQFASEPMGPEAAHILPGRQGLWDTAQVMFHYRRDASDRLVIGTMGRVLGNKDTGLTRRWAERMVGRVFPELKGIAFEEAWHGKIAMTPDHLPRIHRLADGLWTAIGYNGRGITTGTLFGQALADLLTGMDPAELVLPLSEPRAVVGREISNKFYDLAFTATQFWRSMR